MTRLKVIVGAIVAVILGALGFFIGGFRRGEKKAEDNAADDKSKALLKRLDADLKAGNDAAAQKDAFDGIKPRKR